MNKLYIDDIPVNVGGIVEFEAEPIFFEGVNSYETLVRSSECASIEIKMKKKAVRKLVRNIDRELMGNNNWRKLHGLPMHRKGQVK